MIAVSMIAGSEYLFLDGRYLCDYGTNLALTD